MALEAHFGPFTGCNFKDNTKKYHIGPPRLEI
jgi:hypothetical protein